MKTGFVVAPLFLTLLACAAVATDDSVTPPQRRGNRPGESPARRVASTLWGTTRREADTLRVWISWESGQRREPGATLQVAALAPTGAVLWIDTLALGPAGESRRMLTVAASRVTNADRLRLREFPLTEAPTDVGISGSALTRNYVLTDSAHRVLTQPWLRVGEVARPTFFGLETPLTLQQYSTDFQAALPPMAEGVAPPVAPMLTVLSTRLIEPNDTFSIRRPGLYALRQTASPPLQPLLVAGGAFPDIRTATDLIQPLIYLTTRDERQRLYDAPDPKKATDRFWLDVAQGQQEVARGLIRNYYGRVAEANRLFSAHKAGWMTDRGMLFVVLGPPPAVELTPEGEDWVYRDVADAGSARFRFRRRPSTFAPDQYELRRDRGHEAVWYAATAQWRTGITVTAVR